MISDLDWPNWYELTEDDQLRQGDILRDFWGLWVPSALPHFDPGGDDPPPDLTVEAESGDWIVASASCDLHHRAEWVLLCQLLEADREAVRAETDKVLRDRLEVMRRGLMPSRFLLPASDLLAPAFPPSMVIFTSQMVLPMDYVGQYCDRSRLRLRHPFREHFGNWLGERISNVGIEDDDALPRFRSAPMSEKHVLEADDAHGQE